MPTITVSKLIDAPVAEVFRTVAHVDVMSKALPHVTRFEVLTDRTEGVGVRFRETRVMNGREATTELEVTEYTPDERVRMVADTNGTIWDSVFAVRRVDNKTDLTLTMESRPYRLMARIVTPLIQGPIRRAVDKDLELIKKFCEASLRS